MSAILILVLRVFAAISLYIFLGLVILVLWRDLFGIKKSSRSDRSTKIKIRNLTSGVPLIFSTNEIFIGRSGLAQVKLQNDEAVSNMHARIFLKGNVWWVEDLQSTNGTLINQDPIITPTVIMNGDQISCGNTTLEIAVEDNPLSPEI